MCVRLRLQCFLIVLQLLFVKLIEHSVVVDLDEAIRVRPFLADVAEMLAYMVVQRLHLPVLARCLAY